MIHPSLRCVYQRCDLVSASVVCTRYDNMDCTEAGKQDKTACPDYLAVGE